MSDCTTCFGPKTPLSGACIYINIETVVYNIKLTSITGYKVPLPGKGWYFFFTHHHHHHVSVMELGHLLTRSGLTYPEVSSKVCDDSFCQLENVVLLPWVIYYGAFYLHVVSSFCYIPLICPKLLLFLIPLQFVHLFCNQSKCILLFFSCISSLLLSILRQILRR